MKVVLITDTHFGARNDNKFILQNQKTFYQDFFIPYLKENGIDTVLHLGDIYDNRRSVNINTAYFSKKYFFDPLWRMGVSVHAIIGNHDVYFKNTNAVNSPQQLLSGYDNVNIYVNDPVELRIGGSRIGLVPWLNRENSASSLEWIANSSLDLLCGHFEINGFQMTKGVECKHGLDAKLFSNFRTVVSGHFHHRSTIGHINYLGSPYQMAWYDYGNARGFHTYDTETHRLEFHKGPRDLFQKIAYNGEDIDAEKLKIIAEMCRGAYVRLVTKQQDQKFDMLAGAIGEVTPNLSIDIIDDNEVEEIEIEGDGDISDVGSLIDGYIEGSDTKVTKYLQMLLKQAMNQ